MELYQMLAAVRSTFVPAIGEVLSEVETAQVLYDDSTLWEDEFDLPIRLLFKHDVIISVAWCDNESLWLASDRSAHWNFQPPPRWRANLVPALRPALQQRLRAVSLGLVQWGAPQQFHYERWSRLLLHFDVGFVEIFMALDRDGNDFAFHKTQPDGTFVQCI